MKPAHEMTGSDSGFGMICALLLDFYIKHGRRLWFETHFNSRTSGGV
jgi:hypothetical protein